MNLSVHMHFLLIACDLMYIFCCWGGDMRTVVSMLTILDTTVQITHQYGQASHICIPLINS